MEIHYSKGSMHIIKKSVIMHKNVNNYTNTSIYHIYLTKLLESGFSHCFVILY